MMSIIKINVPFVVNIILHIQTVTKKDDFKI